MAKPFDYQILANRFVLKLKLCKNSSAIFPIDILLMVMRSEEIVWHFGQHPHLNTTRDYHGGFKCTASSVVFCQRHTNEKILVLV